MKKQIKKTLTDKFYHYRFYLLFLALLNSLMIPPITVFPFLQLTFKIISISILLLSSVNFLEKNKKKLRTAWFILGIIIAVVSFFSQYMPQNTIYGLIDNFLRLIFFSLITTSLLRQIFAIEEVTADVILGSFCGYLLLGALFFSAFTIIDLSNPSAISGLSSEMIIRENQIFYFTFSCLTTAGFGDIVATTIFSQKLAVFTASIGQFYIAVVVATLISRYLNFQNKKQTKTDK